ncbi:ABC transporter substrate-binding protein [Salinisphaera sp.]|uniref:ABC transporter substrate-binding protein n=1 Tax=Salinisphaera sp. TaxID=1914330 RepID=UPI002D784EDF|nr:ABC transporter substrate-binding protein [Salinisphaera sp.]HET7313214.1 ABC transporter substrate-binding protein [Salinisphaera sp.]
MKNMRRMLAGLALAAVVAPAAQAATPLIINSGLSNPPSAKAFAEIVAEFNKQHPEIKTEVNIYDHEAEKTAIRNWLVASPPDLVYWYPGTRMHLFVKHHLFADVSDLWKNLDFKSKVSPAVTEQLTWHGKQWGMPYTYYMWGIYYRKDLFKKYGLEPPKTWDDLLKVSATLQKNGIKPFALGDKELWPAAAWFDYLDMRINGYAFHEKLCHGKIPYTDPRVRKVFEHWATLIKNDYFTENATSYRWQGAQRFLVNGKAGMFLIGSFFQQNIPEDKRDEIGFVRFPQINPDVAMAEDAPIDMFAVPQRAEHKKAAKTFLAFLVKPENQTKLNRALGQLPVVKAAEAPNNPILQHQFQIMQKVEHTAQFYDRDNKPEMAKQAMTQFQRFLAYPDQMDSIIKKLEQARQKVYE